MDWTPERLATLAHKWRAGLSTQLIADHMGITKNAVVGKAHRHPDLCPPRPSPIRRTGEAKPYVRRAPRKTLDSLPSLRVVVVRAPEPPPSPKPAPPPRVARGPSLPCCWPIGEPRTKAFRYCDAPSIAGRPYCGEHHALAYLPPPRLRTAAEREADQHRAWVMKAQAVGGRR